MDMHKLIHSAACVLFFSTTLFAQHSTMTSTSSIDWAKQQFISHVTLDTEKAGIIMPSGRNAASEMMHIKMPILMKDPLFSLCIDNSHQLGDLIADNTLTLKQITDIINTGKITPAVFKNGTMTMELTNKININNIGRLLVRQKNPYVPREPIESISSRAYSGIVIDARGNLPVQGEYVESAVSPCFFPKVWNQNMDVVYERDMIEFNTAQKNGIVLYSATDNFNAYSNRIGHDPLYIRASKVYGRNRTDPVISTSDALRILTVAENRMLLQQGKVVILLDEDNITGNIAIPKKDSAYYASYNTIRRELAEKKPDEISRDDDIFPNNNVSPSNDKPYINVNDGPNGITILMENLKFLPDSSELLPSEQERITRIANSLKEIVKNNEYTILVEGHTADVGKPQGQMNLSIERTRTIMNALINEGIPSTLFTYRGYGGTMPAASNDTEEGRKQNRRVIITVRPKAITYVQYEQ